MKRILLLMLFGLSTVIAFAQTTWTGLGANTNWNNTDNWDTNAVPTAMDDVIIPTGFTVTLNVSGSVQSIDLQGDSIFEMNSSFSYAGNSNFGPNTTVNWSSGVLSGPTFTLTNQGVINLISTAGKTITSETILNNENTINLTSSGDLFLTGVDATLNNLETGIIDMQFDAGNITWAGTPGVINNSGLIKKTGSTGEAQIITSLNNNDGTIQVEEGILSFQFTPKSFTDGTYNVFSTGTLDWDVAVTISGSLGGILDGNMNWNSNITVEGGDSADLNFAQNFNWASGILSGGGTLDNNGTITMTSTSGKSITGDTTLNNSGTITIASSGDLFLNGTDTKVNNLESGVIDMQFDAGNITWSGTPGVVNNTGLIKKTVSTGEAQIIAALNNNDGTIQVEEGILSFQSTSKNFTNGTYNVFTDATLDWDVPVTIEGSLGGTLDGVMNWNSNISVLFGNSADLNFDQNFNWAAGTLSGGGVLDNNGVMSLTSNSGKTLTGDTTLNNSGTISIVSAGDLFLNGTGSIVNNLASGVIDMQFDAGNFTWSGTPGVINNTGLIKKTVSPGEAQIIAVLNNNGGTIQVEEGILSFQSTPKSFTDGTYNVFADATLDWDVAVTLSGSLGGTLDGSMNWNNNISVVSGDNADLNFAQNFNWAAGVLSGGGVLENNGAISLTSNAGKTINADTTLNNSGTIAIVSAGDLFVIGANTILNNLASGVIDMQFNAGNITWSGTSGVFNNSGLLRRSISTGVAQIFTDFNNSGTIEVASGELEVATSRPFNNLESGTVKGVGIFDLPSLANYTNNGVFAPGLSPGTLTVQGDYRSTTTSELEIEINGLTPDTEYDVLNVIGNTAVFEGNVNVIMGFEGTVGDEFTIATVTGNILTGNLQSPIENVDFDGKRYTFEVSYPDNDKVVLTITEKLDILPPDIITQNITVQLDGTGNVSILPSDIDNGTTDNCTPTNELQFTLDVDSFTCANVGDNTVNLTVTDNDGNFASASAIVTVEDVDAPTAIAEDITVALDASGNASILASEVDNGSSDNCAIADLSLDTTDFTCSDLGANTVTLTATDSSGNTASTTATVTVEDTIAPTVIAQSVSIQLDASGAATITTGDINNGSTDNCSIADLSLDLTDFTCADLGDNDVTLTATDQSGNLASQTVTVTVLDNLNPTAVAQDLNVVLDATGNATILASELDNGSSDNCAIADLSLDVSDFTCADLGANTVNLTVTDSSGNSSSASATVTVEDNSAPIVATQNVTIQLDASGNASVIAADIDNGSTDNCSVASISLDTSDFTCADLGANTVNLTVTDSSGNSASASATVTVEDNTAPTVATQNLTVQLDASGNASITASEIDNGSSDNCSVASISLDTSDFTCADLGANTVDLTVTDSSGNSASASATVTVEDNIVPVITCPNGQTVETVGDFILPDYFADGDLAVTENCGFNVVQTPAPGTNLPDGEYLIEFDVTDAAGNTVSCAFNLKVDDTTLSNDSFELTEQSITMFPNPASNVLNIRNNSNLKLTTLEIFDVTGKLVNRIPANTTNSETVQVSLSNYSNGVYFIRVNAENSTLTKRFIKQ